MRAATRTELVLDRAHNAVISMDELGLVTYWNPSAEGMFGIEHERAVGRAVADLVVPERFRAAHTAGLQRFLVDGTGPLLDRRVEMTALRSDGSEFPVEMTISAIRDRSGLTFTTFLQDISARQAAERERERLVDELQQALAGSERRFEAIVGGLSDPVTIRDRSHHITYANRAALVHLGFGSTEELRRTPPAEIMRDYVVSGEDGGEVSMDAIPSVRLLRGEAPEPLLIRTVNRHSGEERWNLLKASPLLDEAGQVESTIMVIEDVTEQKRTERRVAFLAEASRALASSLDYQRTLRNVAELAVPHIADWCAVDLVDRDGDRVSVSVAHVDPEKLRLADELRTYEPARPDPAQGLGLVLRTGEALLYPEITEQMIGQAAVDGRHLELLRAVGFRSAAVIPIKLGERVLGAMTLVSAESGRTLDQSDLELAEQVGARAAVAIENSRIYSERSRIAHTLQQSLLPEELPDVPGYELASAYIPAFEHNEVGGDFYDVWQARGQWMLAVGDVTGKGVEAAALTALVRHTLRATSDFLSSPAELLVQLDVTLKRQRRRSVCTAICARIEPDGVTLAVGGHPLPLRVHPSGAEQVGEFGALLGAFDEVDWHDLHVDLAPGNTLVFFTDGVTDAIGDDGERYGLERLHVALARCGGCTAEQVVETVTGAVEAFQAGEHADDTAVLALHRRPDPGHPSEGQDREPLRNDMASSA
ncbi:MAG TPA: SpoIIE family protein phosphatase [Solirubrobacteraceae bacterium]